MRSLKWFAAAVLVMALAAPDALASTRVGTVPSHAKRPVRRAAQIIDNNDRMNVNNLDMVVTNHGSLAYDLVTGNAGLIYPRGTTKTAVFAAGLWIGAKVGGETRATVGEYSQEYVPGPMLNGTFQPDQPSFKNFRFERGTPLTGSDLADYLAQGGPTDSTGSPQLLGDATIWSVFNDADPGAHTNEAGSTAPLGIEVQQSVFAYNRSGALGNLIFVKWRLINKGANTLDSAYVSVWSDPDLGGSTDDLVGCDTTLSLGYCYNANNNDQLYGSTPPAVGYDFFKGPVVSGTPLGMTSFNKYINGTDPASPIETYNYMLGLNKDGTPVHLLNDTTLAITKFQVSGLDPGGTSSATNWLDANPNDRRLMLSSGPFTMAPGDTQEVVTAIIMGQGLNRIASVTDLKDKDAAAQTVFDLNFDIPQPPPSPVVYVQPLDRKIRLVWDSKAVGTHSANVPLGQDFVFEGYRVWQLPSRGGTAGAKVIATFDIGGDGIGSIYSDLFNANAGGIERTLVVSGTDDKDLRFQFDVSSDFIRGGNLVNFKEYYYAVTAFSYDSLHTAPYDVGPNTIGTVTDVLESALNTVTATPRGSNSVLTVNAKQIAGGAVGNDVVAEQLQGSVIADSTYNIVFHPDQSWDLINVGSGQTLLSNQTSVNGGYDSPIVNGFMPRVIQTTDPATMYQITGGSGLLGAADSISFFPPGNADSTGTLTIDNYIDPNDITWWNFNDSDRHDYLVRILPTASKHAWTYEGGDPSTQLAFDVPIEVYDLGECSYADPSDDKEVSVMVRDFDGSGDFSYGDAVYIRTIPYASVPWGTPSLSSADYTADDAASQTLGRLTFEPVGSATVLPTEGRFVIRGGRLCPSDIYQFKTVPSGTAAGTIVKNDMNRILAVPNPYYAHSQYELTQFDRVMKFTNIPSSKKVTIRIFNLGGDLIRTITRSAANGDDMSSSQITWDLNTENHLPVASGVYIVRIDVDGVGSKTTRVAVFVEQERLDNF